MSGNMVDWTRDCLCMDGHICLAMFSVLMKSAIQWHEEGMNYSFQGLREYNKIIDCMIYSSSINMQIDAGPTSAIRNQIVLFFSSLRLEQQAKATSRILNSIMNGSCSKQV